MNYNVDYFINKFEAIPEDMWITGHYDGIGGKHCALGFCGSDATEEGGILKALLEQVIDGLAIDLNDMKTGKYQQPTPKQRILAALYDIKAKQDAEKYKPLTLPKDDRKFYCNKQYREYSFSPTNPPTETTGKELVENLN